MTTFRTQVRDQRWAWRSDIKAQIINTDIDGLLTACLLHHLKGWPIKGLYDTRRLWLATDVDVPLTLTDYIWVDIDMCWPGTLSLSQHVVSNAPSDIHDVAAYATTINPSLLQGRSRQGNYTGKYPFGTFQWAWWLAVQRDGWPRIDDRLRTGLAWMPDGGFDSITGNWTANCVRWATEVMPGSILEPLVRHDQGNSARTLVAEACEYLKRVSGVKEPALWKNLQFNMTRASSTGPVLIADPVHFVEELQAIIDAICDVFEWKPLTFPRLSACHEGSWHHGSAPPLGWPQSANEFKVVSIAVTGRNHFCWTSPSPPPGSQAAPIGDALGGVRPDVFFSGDGLIIEAPALQQVTDQLPTSSAES